MSENYSRRNHSSKEEKKSAPKVTEHVTKGFTAFQKVLTAVGTILSIIVASITIMNFTASKNKDTSDSSANQSTVVIKEGNNKTQESSAASSSYGNATDSETQTSSQAGTNTYSWQYDYLFISSYCRHNIWQCDYWWRNNW